MVQENGIWRRTRPESLGGPLRPAVFLDRDGVIVKDPGYLHRIDEITYIDGALEAIARLNRAGKLVIIVTNQSGIARGYYGWPEFEQVQNAIEAELATCGGWVDGVWACPFYPEHWYRKPQPGMLLEAKRILPVLASRCLLIGDSENDVEAARRAAMPSIRVGLPDSPDSTLRAVVDVLEAKSTPGV